jgi:hypothetical protein
VRGVPRPLLAQPGEVWEWEGGRTFYVVRYDHRGRTGQMFWGLNLDSGQAEDLWMSYDAFNGWKRLA